ncbi:MAG TPA: superoxide dismutase family protein, partial [Pseudomonadales bacterium]|nr:superoxide dismutase family protein [Pseudomonadales bacterium]
MRIPALFATCLLASTAALAAETSTPLNLVTAQGIGAAVGSVRITETPYGLVFQPALQGLPPGLHGFHVHEHGTCMPAQKNGVAVAALAAGGHLD